MHMQRMNEIGVDEFFVYIWEQCIVAILKLFDVWRPFVPSWDDTNCYALRYFIGHNVEYIRPEFRLKKTQTNTAIAER